MITNKELAAEMGVCVDTLAMRRKLLKLTPTFFRHSKHRWSRRDADNFIQRWSEYSRGGFQTGKRRLKSPKPRKK
jgi:hypothetical protein